MDKLPDPSERDIKKAIVTWLNLQFQTFAFVVTTTGVPDAKIRGGFRTNPNSGISDILGSKGGKFFAMEVKTLTGEVTEDQKKFLTSVNISGGYECIVRSLEDAQEAFMEI